MLVEHTLLASGDITENGAVYAGWPARQLDERRASEITMIDHSMVTEKDESKASTLVSKASTIVSKSSMASMASSQ